MTAEELEFLSRLRNQPEGVMCLLEKQALTDFQVFGERSSGTNAAEWLIKENTNLDPVKNYGWKHGFPVALAYHPASLIVMTIRDPIDWVVSMFNNPHAAHKDVNTKDFSAFIRGEWAMFVRPRIDRFWRRPWQMTVRPDVGGQECTFDRDPITGRRFRNVMQMRYAKLSSMLSIRNREANFCLVKFEDLDSDPLPFLNSIRSATALKPMADFKPLPSDPLNPKGKSAARAMKRDDISEEDYSYLLHEFNTETESAIGYM